MLVLYCTVLLLAFYFCFCSPVDKIYFVLVDLIWKRKRPTDLILVVDDDNEEEEEERRGEVINVGNIS